MSKNRFYRTDDINDKTIGEVRVILGKVQIASYDLGNIDRRINSHDSKNKTTSNDYRNKIDSIETQLSKTLEAFEAFNDDANKLLSANIMRAAAGFLNLKKEAEDLVKKIDAFNKTIAPARPTTEAPHQTPDIDQSQVKNRERSKAISRQNAVSEITNDNTEPRLRRRNARGDLGTLAKEMGIFNESSTDTKTDSEPEHRKSGEENHHSNGTPGLRKSSDNKA